MVRDWAYQPPSRFITVKYTTVNPHWQGGRVVKAPDLGDPGPRISLVGNRASSNLVLVSCYLLLFLLLFVALFSFKSTTKSFGRVLSILFHHFALPKPRRCSFHRHRNACSSGGNLHRLPPGPVTRQQASKRHALWAQPPSSLPSASSLQRRSPARLHIQAGSRRLSMTWEEAPGRWM